MKIEHLAIWVQDIEIMKDFYETYFDAIAGQRYHNPIKKFTSYFLSFDSGPRLELMHRSDIKSGEFQLGQEHIGISHFAFSVGTKDRVNQLTEQFESDGHNVIGAPRTTGDGYYESVIEDPEGNRIEITV